MEWTEGLLSHMQGAKALRQVDIYTKSLFTFFLVAGHPFLQEFKDLDKKGKNKELLR